MEEFLNKKNGVEHYSQVTNGGYPDTNILEKVIDWCLSSNSTSESSHSLCLPNQIQMEKIENINKAIDELYSNYRNLNLEIYKGTACIADLQHARDQSLTELWSILKESHLSWQSLIIELLLRNPNPITDERIHVTLASLSEISETECSPTEDTLDLIRTDEDRRQFVHSPKNDAAPNEHTYKSFGLVGCKPLERFLLFGGEKSLELLASSVHRLQQGSSVSDLEKSEISPPAWFEEPFQIWFRERNEHDANRIARRGSHSQTRPFLQYNSQRRGIFLEIPMQPISPEIKSLHGTLLVWGEHKHLIREMQVPLYRREGSIFTEELTLEMENPSGSYHLELFTDGTPLIWDVPGLSGNPQNIAFDYLTGRVIDSDCEISDRFILILEIGTACIPESILLESGRLYGGWHDFYTCTINPDPNTPVLISNLLELGNNGCKPLDMAIFDAELWPFDPLIRLNDLQTILGPPPDLQIRYNDHTTLWETEIEIHPRQTASLPEPIFFRIAEIKDICKFDKSPDCCTIALSDDRLLGPFPWGFFTFRVRNRFCRSDSRISFAILPNLSCRLQKQIYLPDEKENSDPYVAEIEYSVSCTLEPVLGTKFEKTNAGCILRSSTDPCLQTDLQYNAGEGRQFSTQLTLTLPHLAWRFENYGRMTASPLYRNPVEMTEDQLDQYGRDMGVAIYLPEDYSGQVQLIESTLGRSQTLQLVGGKAFFRFELVRDAIVQPSSDTIDFDLSFSGDEVHGALNTRLFTIQIWYVVHLTEKPVNTMTETGENILMISWEENYQALRRYVILWRYDSPERPHLKMIEELIPDGLNKWTLHRVPSLPPGIYYLQFYRRADDWAPPISSFAGEHDINTYQFTIELKEEEELNMGNKAFVDSQYAKAVACYKKLQMNNSNLGAYWKYKILDNLIYPKKITEASSCFDQLLDEELLSDVDASFITFQLVALFEWITKKSQSVSCDEINALVKPFSVIAHSDYTNSKKIIKENLSKMRQALNQCKHLDEEGKEANLKKIQELAAELTMRPVVAPKPSRPDPSPRRRIRR